MTMPQILGADRFGRREAHVRRALAGQGATFEDAGLAPEGVPL